MSLEIMLKDLRLTAFNQHLEDYQRQAIEKSWSYTDFLAKLCEQELARRFQTRITNWTREAKLPAGKSFATLKLEEWLDAIKQAVLQLKADHQWALKADNILLVEPSGVGKSHLAAAVSRQRDKIVDVRQVNTNLMVS